MYFLPEGQLFIFHKKILVRRNKGLGFSLRLIRPWRKPSRYPALIFYVGYNLLEKLVLG